MGHGWVFQTSFNINNYIVTVDIEEHLTTQFCTLEQFLEEDSEGVVQRCSVKMVFGKISQDSQESTCVRGSSTGVFL